MSSILIWKYVALNTYIEEINYIILKWNNKEVQKFKDLVVENLERLSKNPKMGVYLEKDNIYSLMISKQTTLYYKVIESEKRIELLIFWNNQKNPADLIKLL
jgi:plasmid stabilization system protein ParE